jgi:hypothetical protein
VLIKIRMEQLFCLIRTLDASQFGRFGRVVIMRRELPGGRGMGRTRIPLPPSIRHFTPAGRGREVTDGRERGGGGGGVRRLVTIAVAIAALAVVAVPVVGAVPAVAAVPAAKKTPTPIQALDSFAFTFSLSVTGTGTGALSSLTVDTKGTYRAPSDQDCTANGALGALKVQQRAVVVGKKVWVDSGSGLERAKASDVEFAGECPSDPAFWKNFDLGSTSTITGTAETKNGIKVEHIDLSSAAGELSKLGIFEKLPSDVTVNTLEAWRASKGGWIAAIDIGLTASSDATCADILGSALPVTIPAPCTVKVAYAISRPDDTTIKISAPKSSGRSK